MNRALSILFFSFLIFMGCDRASPPKVFVMTDINLVGGDPDDRQSFLHLLWYSDELEILGIVPDRWDGKGYEACMIGLEAYKKDYREFGFNAKGMISPVDIKSLIIKSNDEAVEKLKALSTEEEDPIYVLVWGGMTTLKNALQTYPEISDHIRILTIGTGVKYGPRDEVPGEDCNVVNWNGQGRNDIYNDQRFNETWWIESNWTYNGMFMGDEPGEMFDRLATYGAMGAQIKEVTQGHDWAQYFRVGDTPTVTYLIDTDHNVDDPESSSWAGLFKKPFPKMRPNYFTDDNGDIEWDYANPCNTWENMEAMYSYNKNTLLNEREEMYRALIAKLDRLYDR